MKHYYKIAILLLLVLSVLLPCLTACGNHSSDREDEDFLFSVTHTDCGTIRYIVKKETGYLLYIEKDDYVGTGVNRLFPYWVDKNTVVLGDAYLTLVKMETDVKVCLEVVLSSTVDVPDSDIKAAQPRVLYLADQVPSAWHDPTGAQSQATLFVEVINYV